MSYDRTHVLYVAEFATGGSIESLLCLVDGLDKREFEAGILFYALPDERMCERVERTGARVLSLYPRRSTKGARRPQQKKYNLQSGVRRLLGRRAEYAYESFKYALAYYRRRRHITRDLRAAIASAEPDLVHFNNGIVSDTPGLLATRDGRIPTVCHARNFSKPTWLSLSAGRHVNAYICISSAVRRALVDDGIDPDRAVVVPNAVDLSRFDADSTAAADIRSAFGWGAGDTVFALIGRIVSWKGQDYFIEAIAAARRSNPAIRGVIVGDSDSPAESAAFVDRLHALVERHGLADSVRFTGHRSDVPEVMKAADAVVCASSLPEPFGRVIIESMAVGTPVIATDAGGAPDIIDSGENGLLVPIRDADALANAMLELGRDRALADRLRQAGLQTVRDRYTVARHADRVADIYRSVLADGRPVSPATKKPPE